MEIFIFDRVDTLLLIIFGVLFICQLFYFLLVYNRVFKRFKQIIKGKIKFEEECQPLSVILYVNNETESLRKNLPLILEQDYPEFEVIVVNDSSNDKVDEVLTSLERAYSNFYHTYIPEGSRGISRKKFGITLGIKASKYNWLVLTNPDCYPISKNWLRLMARNFTPETDIVLGYSRYEKVKGWFQKKVSFDNLLFALRFLAFALMGKPYMGQGRNMAYRKDVFFHHKGFSRHLNLKKGDDDLFINNIVTSCNTRVETDSEAVVCVSPLKSYKQWKEEKINYTVTSHFFKGNQKYWLGWETFSRLLFYAIFILLIIKAILFHQWIVLGIAILIFIIRFIIQTVIINRISKRLDDRKYYLSLPIFDLILPLDNLKFKFYRLIRKKRDFMNR